MAARRFTSGNLGALDAAWLNELAARVDALESRAGGRGRAAIMPRAVLARITGVSSDRYSWVELERTSATALGVRAGGLSSTGPVGAYDYPAIDIGHGTLVTNSEVVLFPCHDDDGALYYTTTGLPSGSVRWAIITGSSGTAPRFTYTMKEAIRSGGVWVEDATGATFTAYNGAENVDESGDVYGVGHDFSGLDGVVRNAIRTGVAVPCVLDRDGAWGFSLGNGFGGDCAEVALDPPEEFVGEP